MRSLLPVLLFALAPTAEAQFLNRALWLGEEESFRRDFRQGEEYFIDRAGYVDRAPWWNAGDLDPFRNRASFAGGSVNSRDLTLESSLQVGVPLGASTRFRAQHLGSEHQSAQYQRFGVGLERDLGPASALLFQLEGGVAKERADASLGAEYARGEHSAHRVLFTLVDWSDGKSDIFQYDSAPYGLMFAGWSGAPDKVQFTYDIGVQLPFEERQLATDSVLELTRVVGAVELRVPMTTRNWLITSLDGEWTTKDFRTEDPLDSELESGDIQRGRLRLDWWRQGDHDRDTLLGLFWYQVDEEFERPNDPASSLWTQNLGVGATLRTRLPINNRWTLEPYLIAGHIDLTELEGGVEQNIDPQPFQGKWGIPALVQFSPSAFLRFDLSMQLDEAAFAGGGVQFQMSF
jgi:hypothetical protein